MKIEYKIFKLIIIITILCSCTRYDESTEVSDVKKEETIYLKSISQEPTVFINIKGKGNIEGNAMVTLLLNGSEYKTEQISGKVSFTWAGDWYTNDAEILYSPINVKSGELKFEYKF